MPLIILYIYRRQRSYSPTSNIYHLVPDSLVIDADRAVFEVVNKESDIGKSTFAIKVIRLVV